jgi:hypothetical protein
MDFQKVFPAKFACMVILFLMQTFPVLAEKKEKAKPAELEVLKASVGVWDAKIEVWPQGVSCRNKNRSLDDEGQIAGREELVSGS